MSLPTTTDLGKRTPNFTVPPFEKTAETYAILHKLYLHTQKRDAMAHILIDAEKNRVHEADLLGIRLMLADNGILTWMGLYMYCIILYYEQANECNACCMPSAYQQKTCHEQE